nr:MAG TPA: hypothetical protein [Caudoviricetes sp.]
MGKLFIIKPSIYHNSKGYASPIYIRRYEITEPFRLENKHRAVFFIFSLLLRQNPPNPQICQKQGKTSFSRRFFKKHATYNPTILQFAFLTSLTLYVYINISICYVVFCSFDEFVGL